jgi:phosphonate transport system substrate-binding protein
MPHTRLTVRPLVVLSALLVSLMAAACAPAPSGPSQSPLPAMTLSGGGRPLVIGEVAADPVKKSKRFQPLADYLGERLGPVGVTSGEVRMAPDMDVMVRLLQAGEVDVIVDSPYPAMIISDRSGALPILRRWKEGEADYSSLIIARADRGLSSVADLAGQMVAFEVDYSTSGYFLPLTHMLAAGLNPVEKASAESSVRRAEVGYVFARDDDNIVQWVVGGKVAAGAVDNRAFLKIPDEARSQLVILAETERLPRHVVLVRSGLDPRVVEALKTELLAMSESPAGLPVLEAFEATARFDEFPTDMALDRMRMLYRSISGS